MPHETTPTHRTQRAARTFNRRLLLKGCLATGALALSGCQTTASRKQPQLNIAIWSDYLTNTFRDDFARETGIAIVAVHGATSTLQKQDHTDAWHGTLVQRNDAPPEASPHRLAE